MSPTTGAIAHTMEPDVATPVHQMPATYQVLAHDTHPIPTEEQITRTVFFIIVAASVLFIAATLFLSHM
jgi:hypothetical protein